MILDDAGLHLHQSDIETYMQCPEKLRLGFIASMGDETDSSDAAFVGTTVHAVIEHELMGDTPYSSLKEAQNFGAYAFLEGMEEMARMGTTYSRHTFGTDSKALAALAPLVEGWYNSQERDELLHTPKDEILVEWAFDIPFTVTPSGLTIYLAGRTDLIWKNQVDDWKTSSSMQQYKKWEKQRWAVQPTVYLWAAAHSGIIFPDEKDVFNFNFKVLERKMRDVTIQTVPVTRTMSNFVWLERLCQNIAIQMDHGIDHEWSLNDHSALCGPKWCPFWNNCKGQYVDADKEWQ